MIVSPLLVLQELNRFLGNRGHQAVIGLAHVSGDTVTCSWIGNPRMFSFLPDGTCVSRIEPIESQPVAVLGQPNTLNPCQISFELEDEEVVVLTTDGINQDVLQLKAKDVLRARTYREWHELGEICRADADWCFVVFPIEQRFSFARSDWPYNPFVEPQEDYEHEKRGLANIASELFRHREFDGFQIVGGITFPNANATRRLDGVLVSPLGIVLLELKDHVGDIRLPLSNRQPMQVSKDGEYRKESNPVYKVIEVMPTFERFNLGADIDLPLRKIGAVVFTHPLAVVNCLLSEGTVQALPVKSGDIFIVTPKQLAGQLKSFVRKIKGKHNRRPLEGKIERIVSALLAPSATALPEMSAGRVLTNGYRISEQALEIESTGYYQIYRGQNPANELSVWIKEYKLSQVSRGDKSAEADRIGREAWALEKLNVADVSGIQKSLGSFQEGDSLFVVLNEAPALRLDNWLASQPDRQERLSVLSRLAELLGEIAAQNIVHRAVSPTNVRINSRSQPVLINFELCRMETLQTLPMTGRQQLHLEYVARETNIPGTRITPAADIYSLGKLIILVLSGELPFSTYHDQPLRERTPGFWQGIAQKCGLPEHTANDLASMLVVNPARRPSASQVAEVLKSWK